MLFCCSDNRVWVLDGSSRREICRTLGTFNLVDHLPCFGAMAVAVLFHLAIPARGCGAEVLVHDRKSIVQRTLQCRFCYVLWVFHCLSGVGVSQRGELVQEYAVRRQLAEFQHSIQ